MKPILVGLCSLALTACDPMPMEFDFVNEGSGPIQFAIGDKEAGDASLTHIAAGATIHDRQLPMALHGEKWFSETTDEEQFQYRLKEGVTIFDAQYRRKHLSVIALRAYAKYSIPHRFTIRIPATIFEPAR